jgi:cytochrome c biogenesis protein CcmG/thiol:disulfide interchange protein DsbE
MQRRFLPLAAFGALAGVLGAGLRLNPGEVPSPHIGKPAPPFRLARLQAPAEQFTPAELQGRVWLLNVWASWCAPCRDEHPLLLQLAREIPWPIVGLNTRDDPRSAQEWLRRLGDPYLATASDTDGRVGIDYGVYGVPETFVIDQAGVVRHKHVGPLTSQNWGDELLPVLRRLSA